MKIKMKISSKFWNEVGKWCVAITLPEYESWSDNVWDKSREKAERLMVEKVKRHVARYQELNRSAEERIEFLEFNL